MEQTKNMYDNTPYSRPCSANPSSTTRSTRISPTTRRRLHALTYAIKAGDVPVLFLAGIKSRAEDRKAEAEDFFAAARAQGFAVDQELAAFEAKKQGAATTSHKPRIAFSLGRMRHLLLLLPLITLGLPSAKAQIFLEYEPIYESNHQFMLEDGNYQAIVIYQSHTGHRATYSLAVTVVRDKVVAIHFPNGGYIHKDADLFTDNYSWSGGRLNVDSRDFEGNITSVKADIQLTLRSQQDGIKRFVYDQYIVIIQ